MVGTGPDNDVTVRQNGHGTVETSAEEEESISSAVLTRDGATFKGGIPKTSKDPSNLAGWRTAIRSIVLVLVLVLMLMLMLMIVLVLVFMLMLMPMLMLMLYSRA